MPRNAEEEDAHDGAMNSKSTSPLDTSTSTATTAQLNPNDSVATQHHSPPSPPLQKEPRYIRLPDALYNLRRQYPTVTESVFLECTRCHQWVAVPVLRQIPDEIQEAEVRGCARGLDPIEVRTNSRGPLRHTRQDQLHDKEESALEPPTIQWHSQRMLEKESQLKRTGETDTGAPSSKLNRNNNSSHTSSSLDSVDTSGRRHDSASLPSTAGAAAASSQTMFEQILQELRRRPYRRRATTDEEDKSTGSSGANPSRLHGTLSSRQHPLLYIPNPDNFVCGGWQCAWDGDALADLRREWMDCLYKALPLPAVVEADLISSSPSSNPSQSSFPATPAGPTAQELRQQRKAALNEALAEELHVNRSRRPTRGVAGRLGRFNDDGEGGESGLPSLSLPSQTSSASTEHEMQLSRMQQTWVRAAALHLLRNGDSGEGKEDGVAGDGATATRTRAPFSPASPLISTSCVDEANIGPLLSAYCWAVCDACGKLRRVAQPFPGGAPFVCAMAVTATSSCRAARLNSSAHATAGATSSTSTTGDSHRSDEGRVHRHDHSASAGGVVNACSVSEVDGLLQCSVKLCEAELIAAALSSPFLPYPLKAQLTSLSAGGVAMRGNQNSGSGEGLSQADVARVLLAEPLLRTIQSSVTEAIIEATSSPTSPHSPNSNATTGGSLGAGRSAPGSKKGRVPPTTNPMQKADGVSSSGSEAAVLLERSLPIVRELAKAIKKRGLTWLARQIQLTPAQIQAKREAVLRNALLDGYQPNHTDTAERAADEKVKKQVKKELQEVAGDDPETVPLDDEPMTRSRTRRTATASPLSDATEVVEAPLPPTRRRRAATTAEDALRASPAPPAPPPPPQLETTTTATPNRHVSSCSSSEQPVPQEEVVVKRKRGRPPRQPRAAEPIANAASSIGHHSGANPTTPNTTSTYPDTAKTKRHSSSVKSEDAEEENDADSGGPAAKRARRTSTQIPDEADKTDAAVTPPPAQPPAPRRRGRPPKVRPQTANAEDGKTKQTMHSAKSAAKTDAVAASKATEAEGESEEEEDESDEVDTWEVVHWVQCDRCSKWRIMPHRVASTIKFWECKMRFDKERGRPTTCDDPDDADLST